MTQDTIKRTARGAILSLFLLGVVWAEEPVHFGSAKVKAAVEQELWITDPTPTDMLGLVSLYVGDAQISDIKGLEYATNLETLRLPCNWIHDFSPLSGLVCLQTLVINNNSIGNLSALSGLHNLRYLDAHDSLITDISGLAGLDKLETLILRGNEISNISALSSLTSLRDVTFNGNQITDVSPLLGLTSLRNVDLRCNPLSEEAYHSQIPGIIDRNPGVSIQHDRLTFRLVLSSTAGGSVIHPGEGEFIVDDGNPVYIEAKADPCFVFVGFTGSYSTRTNPFELLLGQDHQIRADFQSVLDVLYVDDDSKNDPGPYDARIGDPGENGKLEHPFDRIQDAIDVAANGATIVVRAGTYRENIDLLGKNIVLTGFDPENPAALAWPVIDGGGAGPVVSLSRGADPNCVLAGLVITAGKGQSVGAIACTGRLTMVNCLIVGNCATNWDGAVLRFADSHAEFINCTMADNCAGQFGAALRLVNSQVTIINSILWGDAPKEIQVEGDDMPSIGYSLVAGGWAGTGNLKADPLFVRRGCWVDRDHPSTLVAPSNPNAVWIAGDYHLQSQAGRWDPIAGQWVQDTATSPCIDAGDQDSPIGKELPPNGGVVDVGVYGGTVEASKSVVPPAP